MSVMKTCTLVAALALASCGGGGGGSTTRNVVKPGAPSAAMDPATQKAGGAPGQKPEGLFNYPKVPDDQRALPIKEWFNPDVTGDLNRDPFRSYLVEETSSKNKANGPHVVDECEKRTVAAEYGLRDLTLVGIVKKGTTAYALFVDSQNFGHIAKRDDCLSKDKARLKEIGSQSITVEIRGEAPPGAPAPPPREEEWKLHPESVELTDKLLNGGSN